MCQRQKKGHVEITFLLREMCLTKAVRIAKAAVAMVQRDQVSPMAAAAKRENRIVETTAGIRGQETEGITEPGILVLEVMKTEATVGIRGAETAETIDADRETAREMETGDRRRELVAERRAVRAEVRREPVAERRAHAAEHRAPVAEHRAHVPEQLDAGPIITAAVSGYLRGLKRRRAVLTGLNRSRKIPARGIKRRRKRERTKSRAKRK